MEDFYAILGVSFHATKEEIKEAYKRKTKQYHPDKGGTDRQFILINNAYEILMDDERRLRYDKEYKQFYERILVQNQAQYQHSKDRERIRNEGDTSETKSNSRSRKGKLVHSLSYIFNGLLILSLFFLWYINAEQKKIQANTNTVLSQKESDLEKSYNKVKDDLESEKAQNSTLKDENTLLQNQLNSSSKNSVVPASTETTDKNNSSDVIDIGSTEADVRRIMGTPTAIDNYSFFTVWHYALSTINFNQNGKVDGWRNTSNNLKLK